MYFWRGTLCLKRYFNEGESMLYQVKDYTYLLGMKGFSERLLINHFILYQGYVKNTNMMMETLERLATEGRAHTIEYAEIKRRMGWEFDGMRLHELYFENLGEHCMMSSQSPLVKKMAEDFGSYKAWEEDFKITASMRGIGWAVLYQDNRTGTLNNFWIEEHHIGHPADRTALLVFDAWEHAYMLDYGLKRNEYIEVFFNNIDWDIVAKRSVCN